MYTHLYMHASITSSLTVAKIVTSSYTVSLHTLSPSDCCLFCFNLGYTHTRTHKHTHSVSRVTMFLSGKLRNLLLVHTQTTTQSQNHSLVKNNSPKSRYSYSCTSPCKVPLPPPNPSPTIKHTFVG